MLTRIDLRGDRSDPSARLPRASAEAVADTRTVVRSVLEQVKTDGDAALRRLSAELDGYDGSKGLEVGVDEARTALAELDPDLRAALERAAQQVRWFHEQARPRDWLVERDGARLGVRHRPLRRVGVYVPGGLGAYPSTVLMTVVPARVAGVDEVVLCTPPGADGDVNRTILAAAALAGADRILRIGGAQAIAAMAYGTDTVPRCDKVVGPGNRFVAEAKQQVAADGVCGNDALEDEVAATGHVERVQTALANQGAAVLVDDIDHAVQVADAFAAEHLEVQTADAAAVAERVRAAGAIFVGGSTPVSLGDYCAGPNHTLPTAGTARFTGGLRTDDFFVPINWVEYSTDALADLAPVVEALGAAENLPAHVRAVRARLERRS